MIQLAIRYVVFGQTFYRAYITDAIFDQTFRRIVQNVYVHQM